MESTVFQFNFVNYYITMNPYIKLNSLKKRGAVNFNYLARRGESEKLEKVGGSMV